MPRNRLSWAKSSAATRQSARENARDECHSELERWNQHFNAIQNSANGGESAWERLVYAGLKTMPLQAPPEETRCRQCTVSFGLGSTSKARAQAPPTLAAIQMPEDLNYGTRCKRAGTFQPAAIRAESGGLRNMLR